LTVRDAAFRYDRVRKLANLSCVPAKHHDFETTVVIEMDVHSRHLMAMVLVVRIRQALCQFAGVVVENIRERCDAFQRDAVIDARPLEAKTRKIANCL
jgi:hypothetical protein